MIDITSIAQLEAFAASLVPTLRPGGIYGLEGELGAGKTTFVKHVAQALGIQAEVISPTFIYHQTYELPASDGGIKRLHHFDLYRLSSDADVAALGLEFDDPAGIHLVEWIEHAPALAARTAARFLFNVQPDGRRTVEVVTS